MYCYERRIHLNTEGNIPWVRPTCVVVAAGKSVRDGFVTRLVGARALGSVTLIGLKISKVARGSTQ